MRLRYVEVENFVNHRSEKVELPDHGFFFLDGPSGNGKSSFIIDAPGFALFGAKATRAERGKVELLRHHDYPDDPMKVRVDFEFDGGEILVIERGIDEKGAGYAVVRDKDGNELAVGPAPVERYIRKRLGGMSWRQLYSAFVARQDEIKKLTSLTGSERRDLVHALLGVRELELAQKEAMDRRKRVKLELERLIEQVGERTRQGMEEKVAEMQLALQQAEAQLAQAEAALVAKQAELARLQAEIAPLTAAKEAKTETTRLEGQIELRKTKLEQLQEKQLRHRQAELLIAEAAGIDQQLAQVAEAIEQTTQEGLRAKRHGELLEEQAAAVERLNEARLAAGAPVRVEVGQGALTLPAGEPADTDMDADASVDVKTKQPSSERLHGRLESIAAERKRLAGERAKRAKDLELLTESGECFTCRRPLSEHAEREHVFQSLQDGLNELEDAERALDAEEEQINRLLPQVTQAEIARGSAERELAKAEEAVSRSEGEIARLVAQGEIGDRDELRAQLKEQRQRQDTLKGRQAEINTLKRDLDPSLAGQIAAATAEQAQDEAKLAEARAKAGVEVDEVKLAQLEQGEQHTREEIAAAEGRLPLLGENRTRTQNELKQAQGEREAFALLLAEREEKATLLRRLEDLVEYFDRFARYLAGEIRPALEEMGSEMLAQLSNGRHIAMRIDDNYDIEIQREEGTWLRAANLSGGEGVRANLCLRLALTRLVSRRTGVPVQFLVLDEPLPSQDQGHVENILTLLKSLEPFYPQLFLISHVPVGGVDYRLTFPTPDGVGRIALEYA